MTYDTWKTTEPEPEYDIIPEDADEAYDRAFAKLSATCLDLKTKRDRYEDALRKIVGWQGYKPTPDGEDDTGDLYLTDYEHGANDMLETLQDIAKEAVS